jgi:hypothetical protein
LAEVDTNFDKEDLGLEGDRELFDGSCKLNEDGLAAAATLAALDWDLEWESGLLGSDRPGFGEWCNFVVENNDLHLEGDG